MANKKFFTDESLATFVSEIKSYTDDIASKKANTSHSHTISDVTNLQTILDGKASNDIVTQSTIGLMTAEDKTQLDYGGIPIVSASSSDGIIYTATVDGMNALTVGMKVTIIPVITSASTTPKLNVNGLGEKTIRMPVTYNSSATSVGAIETWLSKNKPITVTYNGTYWLTTDLPRPSAQYLYGAVPIENGGTGATTVADALTNLGLTNAHETVKYNSSGDDLNLPLLASTTDAPSSGNTYEANYSTGVTVNPSTNTVNASNFNAQNTIRIGNGIMTYDSSNNRIVISFAN